MPSAPRPTATLAQLVLAVSVHVPELGLRPSDRLILTPGAEWPAAVVREIRPDFERLLELLHDGRLRVMGEDVRTATDRMRRLAARQAGEYRLRLRS